MMRQERIEIGFSGTLDGFAQAFARLRVELDAQRLDGIARYNVELVFEEVISNIVRYGAIDGRELHVRVTLEARSDSISLTFDDDGIPFDPCGLPHAHAPRSPPETRVGGFGLLLVRRAASSLEYVRTTAGHNRLVVRLSRGDAATVIHDGAEH
jgi:anti-sigma regulatory factor (Ser/Thr protein kinase)